MAPLGTQNTCAANAATYVACDKWFELNTSLPATSTSITNLLPTDDKDITDQTLCSTAPCTSEIKYGQGLTSLSADGSTPAPGILCTKIWKFESPRIACVQWKVNFSRILKSTDTANDIVLTALKTDTEVPQTYEFRVFVGPNVNSPASSVITSFPVLDVDFNQFYESDLTMGAIGQYSTSLCFALVATFLF